MSCFYCYKIEPCKNYTSKIQSPISKTLRVLHIRTEELYSADPRLPFSLDTTPVGLVYHVLTLVNETKAV